ncbi:MAG: hypothetical protein QOD63_3084 [Actinomycetota bacterium]|jgi:hypothetical protein|nr:hypothetical protein [Actinomycetota bacterium]
MCFSAEADLVAGVVVGAVALDGLRHVHQPAELSLAAVPLALAGHQLIEALVWLGLTGHVSRSVWEPALYAYLVIAFGLLPVLVPIAVAELEPPGDRHRMRGFVLVGATVSFLLMSAVVRGPVVATIQGHHIGYFVDLWHGGVIVAMYVVAVCGPSLASRHRNLRWFGLANLTAAVLLAWISKSSFISLWCVWAAVTSILMVAHLRRTDLRSADLRGAGEVGSAVPETSAGGAEALHPDATGGDPGGHEQVGGGVGEPGRPAHVRRHIWHQGIR